MKEKSKIFCKDDIVSLFDEVFDKKKDKICVLKYEFATNFSRLSPELKKRAKLLRTLIFTKKSLYKIWHKKSDNRIYFYFSTNQENAEKIKFCMNKDGDSKQSTWNVDKADIMPEESLTPWHYQKKLINLRENCQTAYLLSDQISFHETNDFGIDAVEQNFTPEKKYTLQDLYENSHDKSDRDFSEYLHVQKRAHYNKCINYIINYYNEKTELEKLWQLLVISKSHNKKKIKEALLDNITPFPRELLKNCTNKIIEKIKSYKFWQSLAIPDSPNKKALLDNITSFPQKLLKNGTNEIIKKIEALLPYPEQELSLRDLKYFINGCKRIIVNNNSNRNNFIIPKSINGQHNLLDLHTGEQKENSGEQKYAYIGDIVVCDSEHAFNNFAVVDERNHMRPLGEGVRIVGEIGHYESGEEIKIWSLLRSQSVQEQISAYADINIKKICHHTILNSIHVNPFEDTYHYINRLVFDLTCLVCNQKFYLNPFYMKTFVNNMTSHLKINFSKNYTDYYALSHKINAIKRSLSPSLNRKIIIIHNKVTEKFVKKIKKLPASKSLCNIDVEKSIFKAISNSDICIVCLPFETVTELKLAEDILKIVGENNIFIKVDGQNIIGSPLENAIPVSAFIAGGDTVMKINAIKNKCLFQDIKMLECLTVSNKKINLCPVTYSYMENLIQNAAQLVYKSNYLQSIFKEFLLILSNCNIHSFKMVKCKGQSEARKKYTKKDLSVFEDLQKELIHMAYNFTSQETTYSTDLLLLNALENNIKNNNHLTATKVWKRFRKNYCEMIRQNALGMFIDKYKKQIRSKSEELPSLYKLLTQGIQKFDEQRLGQSNNYEQTDNKAIDYDRVIYDWPWA